ncbi:hypothetical protein ABT095_20530 [Kitasatospora sp. NPDC002227]|uniref:hypothetical protein n=1 Tax=Kitasatospora sp. NPDC002227 TaxID=3154773 RepID=UPI0033204A44
MTTQLNAADLAFATANDPQFQLPAHPSVVPGAVVHWSEAGLLIEGTGTRRTLSGRSARQILPDLLPLLDGTRTAGELAEKLGRPPAQIRAVLLLLFSCGLLQDGAAGGPDPQSVLLARLLDTTRVNANAAQAQRRLAEARIGILADGPFAAALAGQLAAMGMRPVELADAGAAAEELHLAVLHAAGQQPGELGPVRPVLPGARRRESRLDARPNHPSTTQYEGDSGARPAGPPTPRADPTRPAGQALGRISRALRGRGVPILLTGPEPEGFFIGPYSAEDYGACPECYLAQVPPAPGRALGGPELSAAAALTAQEVLALVARVGKPASLHTRTWTDPLTGRSEARSLAPRPGCEVCGDPRVPLQDPPYAYAYEHSVAFPPRRLVNPRDHQHHFEPANLALQYETKPYFGVETVELPEAELPAAAAEPGPLTLAALATLLKASVGLKEQPQGRRDKVLRYAPTGGNLGSPTAYLLVRDVPGLPAGAYAYQPIGHRLARTGELPAELREIPEAAVLVLTGALVRVARKYRTFAYRVIHLDTGVALSHLLLLSRRLGLRLANDPDWDEAVLTPPIGVDSEYEPVTAVVRLAGGIR